MRGNLSIEAARVSQVSLLPDVCWSLSRILIYVGGFWGECLESVSGLQPSARS